MKKNFLRSLLLTLGLVTCFVGDGFAAKDTDTTRPQAQVFVNTTCEFEGHYKLHDDALQKFQSCLDDFIKKISNEIQICHVDLKIENVLLDIDKDGHGKFSLLVNTKTDSKSGFDIYSKNCCVFDISIKDNDTFTFDVVTKLLNSQDSTAASMKLSKEIINGEECILLDNNHTDIGRIVFEKVR